MLGLLQRDLEDMNVTNPRMNKYDKMETHAIQIMFLEYKSYCVIATHKNESKPSVFDLDICFALSSFIP